MIGVGIDAVELDRFRNVLARTPTLTERVFTTAERAYAELRQDPTARYAARFAAKEAVMKALGVGLGAFAMRDVEVVHHESGAPSLSLAGRAAEVAAEHGVTAWRLSLTHTERTATAVAIAI
jgi:holo-[acyl-carrier protein] synthase